MCSRATAQTMSASSGISNAAIEDFPFAPYVERRAVGDRSMTFRVISCIPDF